MAPKASSTCRESHWLLSVKNNEELWLCVEQTGSGWKTLKPCKAAFYSPCSSWPSPATLYGCLFCCRPEEPLDSSTPSWQTGAKIFPPRLPVTLLDVCDIFKTTPVSDSLKVPVGVTMFYSWEEMLTALSLNRPDLNVTGDAAEITADIKATKQ